MKEHYENREEEHTSVDAPTIIYQNPFPPTARGPVGPGPEGRETDWSAWIAKRLGSYDHGVEHTLWSSDRIDILTPEYAIEVEWCKRSKITEAARQASFYGVTTGRKSAIILLVGRREYKLERFIFQEMAQEALRRRVTALSWLDVRDPNIEQMKFYLNLTDSYDKSLDPNNYRDMIPPNLQP